VKVTEIYHSIEGEGIEIGRPVVFIRFTGCNLRCDWCDTIYALENGMEMSVSDIINDISKYPCKSVSITGGEPLLQREELLRLIKELKESDYWVQINTNGTVFSDEIFKLVDLITMDCKCPSSGMKSDLDVLSKTKDLFGSKAQFKFVISDEEDYRYSRNIISSFLKDMLNVVLQPEWSSREFAKKLVNLIRKDGLKVRLILQQQKLIWGAKRTV